MGQRLGALDSVFLNLEDAHRPMHIGGLLTFETAPETADRPGIGRIFETIEARLPLLPRCRQRLLDVPLGAGRPLWVDDPDFDINNHLHHVPLPAPGTREQLLEMVSTMHSRCLERGRPLWEMFLIHGLADGRTALYAKVHHAMVDGASALELGLVLLDLDPDGILAPAVPDGAPPRPSPAAPELLAEAAREAVVQAGSGLLSLRAGPRWLRSVLASPGPTASMLKMLRLAPAGPLNGPIGHGRRLRCVRIPLDEIKQVKDHAGASVNDVVLATIGEAVNEYLTHRGVPTAGLRYRVLVPVSVRGANDRAMGNQLSAVVVELPVGPMHAERRLWSVMKEMATNKQHGRAGAAEGMLALSEMTPAPLHAAASRIGIGNQRIVNMVVSNVQGVQMPLYAAGSRTVEMFPLLPLAPNTRLVVCALSYNNQMNLGIVADRASMPDVEVLERGIVRGFDRLKDGAGIGTQPPVTTAAARERARDMAS